MANIKFTNLASSTLAAPITNLATVLTVEDASKFPTISGQEYFIIVVIDDTGNFEIMRVVGVNGASFTVLRAQEGTPARVFAAGCKVEHRLTAESLVTIVEEASITKPHTSADADTYGHATATVYSHVKITDDPKASVDATTGIAISPYAMHTRFSQILGVSAQQIISASSNFTVPETGTYEIMCIGGGGSGGTGGTSVIDNSVNTCESGSPGIACWSLYSGAGGGGGGAGQTVTQQLTLTKGASIPVIIGSSGGNSSFGTYITANAGVAGGNGSAPTSGINGYSYGTLAVSGVAGTTIHGLSVGLGTVTGGVGGNGGISTEGTFGNGGTGGTGGSVIFQDATTYSTKFGTAGAAGTQGCVKIRLVLGS